MELNRCTHVAGVHSSLALLGFLSLYQLYSSLRCFGLLSYSRIKCRTIGPSLCRSLLLFKLSLPSMASHAILSVDHDVLQPVGIKAYNYA